MRCALKGGGCVTSWSGDRRSPAAVSPRSVRMPTGNGGCCSGLQSRAADLADLEMATLRGGVGGLFRSSPRLRALASHGRKCVSGGGAGRAAARRAQVNFSFAKKFSLIFSDFFLLILDEFFYPSFFLFRLNAKKKFIKVFLFSM